MFLPARRWCSGCDGDHDGHGVRFEEAAFAADPPRGLCRHGLCRLLVLLAAPGADAGRVPQRPSARPAASSGKSRAGGGGAVHGDRGRRSRWPAPVAGAGVRLAGRWRAWRGRLAWHCLAWAVCGALRRAGSCPGGGCGGSARVLSPSDEFPGLPVWLYWLAVLVFYGFGEEIGWRGFALPLLQSRFHPVVATLLLSLIWASGTGRSSCFPPGFPCSIPGMAGWFASLVTGAFLLTFLFNASGGSVLVVAIFHATMDIAFLGPPAVAMRVGRSSRSRPCCLRAPREARAGDGDR